jgi:hypothetical protein
MPDGTIYAGVSPETGTAIFTTPADAAQVLTFDEAEHYASNLDAHGHQDWRLPSREELDQLFNWAAELGGFKTNGRLPDGWYWSCSETTDRFAWSQRLSDGFQIDSFKTDSFSVRCVRSGN